MIKKLRKLSNMNILCITNNAKLKSDINSNLNEVKNIIFVESVNDDISDISYDVLLVDFNFEASLEIMNETKISKPSLPKIVILDEQSETNIIKCINAGAYSILSLSCGFADLKLSVIMALNQTKRVDKITLGQDVYYDSYRERFYDKLGELSFTKFEFQVLKLLLQNHARITTYDEIKEKVWKDKKMSIFTMRNIINKIRNKTYYDIIKNISSNGYQIDTPK
ncbi:MAG: winged helix-turn-helix domain-containing protein [Arcobacteraceae bacterium]|nr:winged helix-turn-helix domain-containing protein [Arcobacteraceae bacterium]